MSKIDLRIRNNNKLYSIVLNDYRIGGCKWNDIEHGKCIEFPVNKEDVFVALGVDKTIANLQSQLDQAKSEITKYKILLNDMETENSHLETMLDQANERLKGAIVLPVKIGDTIYVVPSETNYRLNIANGKEEQNKVYEWTISEIRYNKYGFSVVCDVGDVQFYCNYEPPKNLCGHFDTEKYYGETWFTTEQEAQAKLKEMNGDV